ncbi:hypothetical protein [Pseudomonas frederiksbergensis]|nr:hypothetical protein [Pseudomonas frederiksbergensis]
MKLNKPATCATIYCDIAPIVNNAWKIAAMTETILAYLGLVTVLYFDQF